MMGFSRKGIFSIVIVLLFTLLVGCTGGGSSTYTASGKVIDDKGKALAGVKLIVTGGTSIPDATVEADGTFILSKLTKTCIITPHLEGYVFTPKSATIKAATTKLQFIGTPMIMVSAITVTGTGGATTITTDKGTLQMVPTVTPDNASNKAVTWTVTETDGTATDKATISNTGLLTAVKNGTVKVTATAKDGSGKSGFANITITNQMIEKTAAEVAALITTITAPAKDATSLTLPTVEAGYTVAIKSSDKTGVIALSGTITPPATEETVALVLEVTRGAVK
jgi:hypothetical protein